MAQLEDKWKAKLKGRTPEDGEGPVIPRQHFDKNGQPYRPQFIDGHVFESYPDEEEDLAWLMSDIPALPIRRQEKSRDSEKGAQDE